MDRTKEYAEWLNEVRMKRADNKISHIPYVGLKRYAAKINKNSKATYWKN